MLIYFPAENSGKQRKLSRPWHGFYRIVAKDETNITATRVYYPDEKVSKFIKAEYRCVHLIFLQVITGMERSELVQAALQNGWNNCYRLVEQG